MLKRILGAGGAAALAVMFFAATPPADPPLPPTEEVLIASGDGRVLAGTLTLPPNAKPPFGVALSLTGSGLHLRDGNRTPDHPYRPFREIASALAAKGIAMLRLDDRGIGGSTGDGNAASGEDVANDARVAIDWLHTRKDIARGKVALIGHSFGGVVAPMVASTDARIGAMVLMGAPAGTFRETMRYQHQYEIDRDSTISPEKKAQALEQRMTQQASNVQTSAEKWRQWAQNRDPLPTLRRVLCPVLILQGTTDRAVSPDEARLLDSTLRNAANPRVTLRIFDNLNHHFNVDPVGATSGYDRLPTQHVAPEFLETLSSWVAMTLGVRSPAAPAPER